MGNEDVLSESGGGVMLQVHPNTHTNLGFTDRVGDFFVRTFVHRIGFYYIHREQRFNFLRIKSEPRRRR